MHISIIKKIGKSASMRSFLSLAIGIYGNIFIIIVLFVFVSCMKEVEIDFPDHEKKPVINCLFSQGDSILLFLSESKHILSTEQTTWIDNAIVVLRVNGIATDTMIYSGSGQYLSGVTPTIGSTYHIEGLTHLGAFKSAEETLTPPIKSFNISFKDSIRRDENGLLFSQATICFIDNGSQRNFYEIKLEADFINPFSGMERTSSIIFRSNSDPIINAEGIKDYAPTLLISNDLFAGEECCIIADYTREIGFRTGSGILDYDYDLIATFRSVSEGYYRYKKELYNHIDAKPLDKDPWESLGDPVPMFSNIYGGYGIFAGYSEVVDTVFKKD